MGSEVLMSLDPKAAVLERPASTHKYGERRLLGMMSPGDGEHTGKQKEWQIMSQGFS